MRFRRFVFLLPVLFVSLFLLVGVIETPLAKGIIAKESSRQDTPLTLAQILTGLQTQGKTPETRTLAARNKFIAARIRQRGVAFELNEEREKDLRDAGASDELISAIRSVSKSNAKPKSGDEVTELKNPDDIQIEVTRNTGGLKLIQYFVFLLTNASNGLFVSTEEDLKNSVRCGFGGGGTNCKETDLVTYKKILGPFATYEEAKAALCRSVTEIKEFPLGIGLKGRWQTSDNWYGLWNVSIGECSSLIKGGQTETGRQTVFPQTDRDKNYSVIIGNPGQTYSGTLVLTGQGAALSGSLETQFGTWRIKVGKVTSENVSFSARSDNQGQTNEIFVKATMTGNRISGTIETPQGTIPFSGTRNP